VKGSSAGLGDHLDAAPRSGSAWPDHARQAGRILHIEGQQNVSRGLPTGSRTMRAGRTRQLDLPQLAQAGVAVAADDHVVVQHHAKRGGGLLDILGHLDIGLGWCRIARRMIVHQDQRGGTELERALDDLAWIEGVWSTVPRCWRSSLISTFLRSRNKIWNSSILPCATWALQ